MAGIRTVGPARGQMTRSETMDDAKPPAVETKSDDELTNSSIGRITRGEKFRRAALKSDHKQAKAREAALHRVVKDQLQQKEEELERSKSQT